MQKNEVGDAPGPDLLKKFRTKHKLTLQEVADALGCSRSILSEYENRHKTPDLDNRRKIATYTEERQPDGALCPYVPVLSWDSPTKNPDQKKAPGEVVPFERSKEAS